MSRTDGSRILPANAESSAGNPACQVVVREHCAGLAIMPTRILATCSGSSFDGVLGKPARAVGGPSPRRSAGTEADTDEGFGHAGGVEWLA